MTCLQLGGACKEIFEAESFEEMAKLSQQHGKAMFEAGDQAHKEAMEKMMVLMQDPAKMQAWMKSKQEEFEALGS